MAAVPMLAGVGLMMVCCSSSSAMMMMGGEEKEDPVAPGVGAGGTEDPPVPMTDEEIALLPQAVYVRVGKTTDITNQEHRYINLAEVEVFDEKGKNIALNRPVSMSDASNPDYASLTGNLVDDDLTSIARTGGTTQKHWLEINLGGIKRIHKVVIHGKSDTPHNLHKLKVMLYGTDHTWMDEAKSGELTSSNAGEGSIHTFEYPSKTWTHS
jgi:hypothetical protein